MTELARGVDELQGNVLSGSSVGLWQQTLSKGQDSLLNSRTRSLDHNEVVLDSTVTNEAAHRSNSLLGGIEVGGGVVSVGLTNSVDLVVDRCSVVVSVLTSTGNGPLNV